MHHTRYVVRTAHPGLVRIRRTYSSASPGPSCPVPLVRTARRGGGTRSLYVQYGDTCQRSRSQALFAARKEQLMIGAGQPVSLHGSGGPSVQDSDMLKRGGGGVHHQDECCDRVRLSCSGLRQESCKFGINLHRIWRWG